jgi:excisionase family DNA binding protein
MNAAEQQRPLTLDEAARYLNVTPRFVRRLVAERRIAYHKVGALLRFRREDLDGFFAQGRVEPARELPS